MNSHVRTYYRRFRAAGERAGAALRNARILDRFEDLENDGKVKIEAQPEDENYFDVYGEPDTKQERAAIERSLELYGNFWVASYVYCPCCGAWKRVDSIGQCAGY